MPDLRTQWLTPELGATQTIRMRIDINKILALPRFKAFSQSGSSMGRRDQRGTVSEKLHLQRVRLNGDYDTGGAYWGGRALPLWCAFSTAEKSVNDVPVMLFVRAGNREMAKALILSQLGLYKGWSFFH